MSRVVKKSLKTGYRDGQGHIIDQRMNIDPVCLEQ